MKFELTHEQEICIDRYEAARCAGEAVDFASFAPSSNEDGFESTMLELMRVDMEWCWNAGERKSVEQFRDRFPRVLSSASSLQSLAIEEYRMRRRLGEAVDPAEFSTRFRIDTSSWQDVAVGSSLVAADLSADLDDSAEISATRLDMNPQGANVRREMPRVGKRLVDFELVGELGRGAFGRVYLAKQGDLANRYVALKVTPTTSDEPLVLAQMQHTNIVPIYSVHCVDGLQLVCMPFLGANTLHDAIARMRSSKVPKSGAALLSTLERGIDSTLDVGTTESESIAKEPGDERDERRDHHPWPAIRGMPLDQAASWIVMKVAGGLAHAHQLGLIHCDLKPANILLADEGQPLILDFNLAVRPADTQTARKAGGTLPYMAPEHVESLLDVNSRPNAKCDIFSLGVILHELLCGELPFPVRRGTQDDAIRQMILDRQESPDQLKIGETTTSPALTSIVSKCLQPDPASRYESAEQLEQDLSLHLRDRPLRWAPNTSLRERWQKWRRRHPRLTSATSVAAAMIVVLAVVTASWYARGQRIERQATRQLLTSRQESLASSRLALGLNPLAGAGLARTIDEAERALQLEPLASAASADEQRRDERAVNELHYLIATGKSQLAVNLPAGPDRQTLFRSALDHNQLAEGFAKAALSQRARILGVMGDQRQARLSREAAEIAPTDDHLDRYLFAIETASTGELHSARLQLEQITNQRPDYLPAWFSLGVCNLQQSRWAAAESCFTVCTAMRPDFIDAFLYRGVILHQQQRFAAAARDLTKVIEASPDTIAFVNRALARWRLEERELAMEDINAAISRASNSVRPYLVRAQFRQAMSLAGVSDDLDRAMKHRPMDEDGWVARGVARLRSGDIGGAVDDFTAALLLNPNSTTALQNIAYVAAEQLDQPEQALDAMDRIVAINDYDLSRANRAVLASRLNLKIKALRDVKTLLNSTDPAVVYRVGCSLALLQQQGSAESPERQDDEFAEVPISPLPFIHRAIKVDLSYASIAATDADLDLLRTNKEFQQLLAAARSILREREQKD